MSPLESQDLQNLLIRIDERVRTVQEEIREINDTRQCLVHAERLKTMERMVWGCLATMLGLVARIVYEAFN